MGSDFIALPILIGLALSPIVFAAVCLWLFGQLKRLRVNMNQLLEEKAKIATEADYFAEIAKNPLGPLFQKNSHPIILSFNAKGKITDANDELFHRFGYSRRNLIGKNAVGTILPLPEKGTETIIQRIFKNPNLFIDSETETKTKSGESIWISWTNKIVYNRNGKPVSVDAVGFDITRRKQMEAELQYLSTIDPQTGVMNRHALLETGATELKRAKRYQRDLSVAIVKFYAEDTIEFSDKQLEAATRLVRRVIRSVDYVGRIGDVEFAFILPETPAKNVPFLMQRLNQNLAQYNQTKSKNYLSLRYGTAAFKKQTDTIEDLLSTAWRRLDTPIKKTKRKTTK